MGAKEEFMVRREATRKGQMERGVDVVGGIAEGCERGNILVFMDTSATRRRKDGGRHTRMCFVSQPGTGETGRTGKQTTF